MPIDVLPVITGNDSSHNYFDGDTGRIKARQKFQRHLGEKPVSFRERLCDVDWKASLPDKTVIERFAQHVIKDKLAKTNLNKHVFSLIFSQVYVISLISITGMFVLWLVDFPSEALAVSFSALNITRILFNTLAGYTLNLINNISGIATLTKIRKIDSGKIKEVLDDYQNLKDELITAHKQEFAFFTLTEFIYELKNIPVSMAYNEFLLKHKSSVEKGLNVLKDPLSFEALVTDYATGIFLHPTIITLRIKNYLLSPAFREVFLKLNKAITDNFDQVVNRNISSSNPVRFRTDFCDAVFSNRDGLDIIIDYLAEQSAVKHSEYSRLYQNIDLTQLKTSIILKEVLISYWTSDETRELIEPSSVDFDKLAIYINYKIRLEHPSYMIELSHAPGAHILYTPAPIQPPVLSSAHLTPGNDRNATISPPY